MSSTANNANANPAACDDVTDLLNTVPPPPYPGNNSVPPNTASYDLTPTPHSQNRPRLPLNNRNPHLTSLPEDITVVKFQTIVREAKEIVVGRIKVPIPGNNAHAFILRRYDTNAISLTTMFKVAFPGATEEDERREMDWVKSSFDIRDTNGGRGLDVVRLAGQWVSRHLALHLAPAYHIAELVTALARAVPDPNVAYRKSQRSQAAAEQLERSRQGPALDATSPAPKRQRGPEEERQFTLEATTTITSPVGAPVDVDEEIQKSKRLVQELKRDMQASAAAGEEFEPVAESSRGRKRGQGEDTEVVVSEGNVGERVIKTSKRVERAEGTAQKVIWGAVIFGLGVGATFLPQLSGLF